MLTETDIHLIVGMFSFLSTPDNVDIVLGERVHDKASETKRDIDVTIRYKNELGEELTFIGIQVKDHNRKLGSPEVEQLCLHFKDSPSIKKGGIVSASGFTKPGIKKAAYHKIDLYELRDWSHSYQDMSHLMFNENYVFTQKANVFKDKPFVTYLTNDLSEPDKRLFNDNLLVLSTNGNPISNVPRIKELNNHFINLAIYNHKDTKSKLEIANVGDETPINITLNIEDPPYTIVNSRKIILEKVNITGVLIKCHIKTETHFKILVKLDDPEYRVGAAISELTDGTLIGFSTSELDKAVKLFIIPITDRLREKINQIKIK